MLLTLRFVFCFLTTSEETKWGLQASRLLDRLLHLLLLVHSIALLSSLSSLPPLGLRTDLDHVTMVAIECGNLEELCSLSGLVLPSQVYQTGRWHLCSLCLPSFHSLSL